MCCKNHIPMNQKWHPQQRKKKQSAETKTTPSKTDTNLNKKSSTIQLGKHADDFENVHGFFHRPNGLHAPPLFFPGLLKKYEKQTLPSFLPLFLLLLPLLSMTPCFSLNINMCVVGFEWTGEFGFV